MNSLSLMIYTAETLDKVSGIMIFVAIASGIGLALGLFVSGGVGFVDGHENGRKIFKELYKRVWIPVVAAFIYASVPSSHTIYLIAASEAGETVINNPEAREIFNDLKTIIKGKIKEQITEVAK